MITQNTENDPKMLKFEAPCTETCKLSLEALVSGVDAGFSYRGGTKRPTHNHTHILWVWLRVCISHACMKVVIEQKGPSESAELDGLCWALDNNG